MCIVELVVHSSHILLSLVRKEGVQGHSVAEWSCRDTDMKIVVSRVCSSLNGANLSKHIHVIVIGGACVLYNVHKGIVRHCALNCVSEANSATLLSNSLTHEQPGPTAASRSSKFH